MVPDILKGPVERPTIKDIKRIEAYLGGVFPRDYIDFLLAYNGGSPRLDRFEFVENGTSQSDILHCLYGICDDDVYTLERRLKVFSDRVPRLFCPIGSDPFGNQLLISLDATCHGAVYFWDHEKERDEDGESLGDEAASMPLVALSFTAFMNGLR